MTADMGLKLSRLAERQGWASVVEYDAGECWVVDRDPETSFEIACDSQLGLLLATVDVVGTEDLKATEDLRTLLLKTNAEARTTGGLFFSLAADGSRVLLTASLPAALDDDALIAALDALHERAGDWATVITAPVQPGSDVIPDGYIRA
jgi:hypothetical protein